jgi:hypothetical protein
MLRHDMERQNRQALAAMALVAAQSVPALAAPRPRPGLCRQDAAQMLAGRQRVSDRRAKRLTGASIVRQISPGDPITMDFRRERVTIETNSATGRIVRAYCG